MARIFVLFTGSPTSDSICIATELQRAPNSPSTGARIRRHLDETATLMYEIGLRPTVTFLVPPFHSSNGNLDQYGRHTKIERMHDMPEAQDPSKLHKFCTPLVQATN
jgi:hypothetical protein